MVIYLRELLAKELGVSRDCRERQVEQNTSLVDRRYHVHPLLIGNGMVELNLLPDLLQGRNGRVAEGVVGWGTCGHSELLK